MTPKPPTQDPPAPSKEAVELAMRVRHYKNSLGTCATCLMEWPCDAPAFIDAALRAERERVNGRLSRMTIALERTKRRIDPHLCQRQDDQAAACDRCEWSAEIRRALDSEGGKP